jgi:hypothetical protein
MVPGSPRRKHKEIKRKATCSPRQFQEVQLSQQGKAGSLRIHDSAFHDTKRRLRIK